MADVGDVNLQCITSIRQPIHPDRIVEVARGFAIDGYDIERPIILPASQLVLANHVGKVLRLLQNFRRKMMRDVMLPDHDLDIDAEIIRPAEDFDHSANRVLAAFGKFQNLDVDHHAVQIFGRLHVHWRNANAIAAQRGRGQFHPSWDLNPLPDTLVVGGYKIPTLANTKFANHGLVRPPQYFDDLAVSAAIPFDARDANHHAIAVHGGLRRFPRDVNVAFQTFDGMIGNQEPVAVAMHIQAAHRVFAAEPGDYKMTGANFH